MGVGSRGKNGSTLGWGSDPVGEKGKARRRISRGKKKNRNLKGFKMMGAQVRCKTTLKQLITREHHDRNWSKKKSPPKKYGGVKKKEVNQLNGAPRKLRKNEVTQGLQKGRGPFPFI